MHAVESALQIGNGEYEIIVQDCSDTDELKSMLLKKFGDDLRIKYEHTADKPNMTTNWNRAYDRATGDYQCGIGDDDGVLAEIYELAAWAKENDVAAVVNGSSIMYIWPDFKNHFFAGCYVVHKKSDGKMHRLSDQMEIIDSLCQEPSFLFAKLPMAYHCLISKESIISRARQENGELFHGTSLDVYSSVAFSKFYETYVSVDFPFTMKGSSAKSNSGRFYNRQIKEHFVEYTNHEFGSICPPTPSLETTLLESIERGLVDIDQMQKLQKLNIPLLYAKVLASESSYFSVVFQYCRRNLKTRYDWLRFIAYLAKFKIAYTAKDFFRWILKMTSFVFGANSTRRFLHKIGARPDFVVSDTIVSNLAGLRKNLGAINYNTIKLA